MWNLEKALILSLLAAILCFGLSGRIAHSEDQEPVKSLVDKYHRAGDENTKREALKKIRSTEPKTREDMDKLRKLMSDKVWDERLYSSSVDAIGKVKDPALDDDLVEILKDEKPHADKSILKDFGGKSEKEMKLRGRNVAEIIQKLGHHKNKAAVPVLKEYLKLPGYRHFASEALVQIGDTSASEEIRERAYRGEEVNYGGMGLDEANTLIRDIQNETNKKQLYKMANQLMNINNPQAKGELTKLFTHKDEYVRHKAVQKFANMAKREDAEVILEMTINDDWNVRYEAVLAMMRVVDVTFEEALINMLSTEPHRQPRSLAARALGYKKIEKAIPYLEKALKDPENNVRVQAFISLYVLTGKKYDYEGRNATAERMAEKQRKYPIIF